ncbi:MAG TPA: hypothetical protein VFS43_14955 [Polyangiaceae bacterium]|nr:hypothetical protein [Polyangiaceae bacterium]
MPVENPGFEAPGAAPWEAAGWTLVTQARGRRFAAFRPPPVPGVEDFETWAAWNDVFGPSDLAVALFDPLAPEGREDFEEGWGNAPFLTELEPALLVLAPFRGGAEADGFEAAWVPPPAFSWADVASASALFGDAPLERFEAGWRGNEAFLWAWAAVPSTPASFDGGAGGQETFSGAWTPMTTLGGP